MHRPTSCSISTHSRPTSRAVAPSRVRSLDAAPSRPKLSGPIVCCWQPCYHSAGLATWGHTRTGHSLRGRCLQPAHTHPCPRPAQFPFHSLRELRACVSGFQCDHERLTVRFTLSATVKTRSFERARARRVADEPLTQAKLVLSTSPSRTPANAQSPREGRVSAELPWSAWPWSAWPSGVVD